MIFQRVERDATGQPIDTVDVQAVFEGNVGQFGDLGGVNLPRQERNDVAGLTLLIDPVLITFEGDRLKAHLD